MDAKWIDAAGARVSVPDGYQQVRSTPDDPQDAVPLVKETDSSAALVFLYPMRAEDAMPYDAPGTVIEGIHQAHGDDQGLIEVESGKTRSGNRYIYSIVKTMMGPVGVQYGLTMDVEAVGGALHVQGFFDEKGMTGTRASVILAMLSSKGEVGPDMEGWARDPYDETHTRGFLANLSEAAEYDALFPDDPLSMARTFVTCVAGEFGSRGPKSAMNEGEKAKGAPTIPKPMLDDREYKELDGLAKRYEKLIEPGPLARAAGKVTAAVPAGVREAVVQIGNSIFEQEIYERALMLIGTGFKVLEEQAARVTINEESVIRDINAASQTGSINRLEEVCLVRSYDVAKAAHKKAPQHIIAAMIEGGGTGAAGFLGIPFNLVLSTFICYRAVQTIAMSYGYDVKNNPAELVIAGEVFASALGPASKGGDGIVNNVAKFMAISAAQGVRQTAKKTWTAMIERGGPSLLLAQMRALANASARKALEGAGKKGLENSVFREIFEQIGRKLTLGSIKRAIPYVSAGIGAFMDTAQMNTVLQYADIFYHKRFLLEKEERVKLLLGVETDIKGESSVGAGI